jgi:hypothetical protein
MSETGERDGKKPAPAAQPVAFAAAQPAGKPIPSTSPMADLDDLAGWDDTTTIHRPRDIIRNEIDDVTAVHGAAELAKLARSAGPAETAVRQESLLPPKPTLAVPESTLQAPSLPAPARLPGPLPGGGPAPRVRELSAQRLTHNIPAGIEMGRPIFAVAAVGVLFSAGTWLMGSAGSALGALIGAGFAAANLWAFTRLGRGLAGQRRALWGILAAVKLLALFGCTLWVLSTRVAAPLPFLLGYLALPVGIVLSQVLGLKAEFDDGEGSI